MDGAQALNEIVPQAIAKLEPRARAGAEQVAALEQRERLGVGDPGRGRTGGAPGAGRHGAGAGGGGTRTAAHACASFSR